MGMMIPGSENPSLSPGSPQTQLSPAGLAQDLGPTEGNAAVPQGHCATRLESGIRNQEKCTLLETREHGRGV